MPEPTSHQGPDLTNKQIDHILDTTADSFGQQLRSPILHSPAEQDLDYQDVTFNPEPSPRNAGDMNHQRSLVSPCD